MIWKPGMTLEDVKREVILDALEYNDWNRTKSAKALDICIRMIRINLNIWCKEGYITPIVDMSNIGHTNKERHYVIIYRRVVRE